MSPGSKFIRSVIVNDSPQFIRQADEADFAPEDLAVYEFVTTHLAQHRRLPSLDALAENGHTFGRRRVRNDDGPEYYLDRLKDGRAFNVVNELHGDYVSGMEGRNMDQVQETLRDMISGVSAIRRTSQYTTLANVTESVIEEFHTARATVGLQGASLGYHTLNSVTQGAQAGDVIVLAGRPSMGKSWILLEMLYSAWRDGASISLCSMEMSVKQIARRLIGRHLGVNPNRIRSGDVVTWLEQDLLNVQEQFLDERPFHLLPGDMDAGIDAVEQMVDQFDPDIIAVDAAYLMTPRGRNSGLSRWEQIAAVIKQLKQIGIRHDKPVILTVQFNRNVKSKSKKELDLGDIAGSDSIPQDASIVLGITEGMEPNASSQRIIDVMKNRDGETPRFATRFSFDPVDFSEVPLREDGTPEPTTTGDVTSWM